MKSKDIVVKNFRGIGTIAALPDTLKALESKLPAIRDKGSKTGTRAPGPVTSGCYDQTR